MNFCRSINGADTTDDRSDDEDEGDDDGQIKQD